LYKENLNDDNLDLLDKDKKDKENLNIVSNKVNNLTEELKIIN